MSKINTLAQYKRRKNYLQKPHVIKKHDQRVLNKGWTVDEAVANRDFSFACYIERALKRQQKSSFPLQ